MDLVAVGCESDDVKVELGRRMEFLVMYNKCLGQLPCLCANHATRGEK